MNLTNWTCRENPVGSVCCIQLFSDTPALASHFTSATGQSLRFCIYIYRCTSSEAVIAKTLTTLENENMWIFMAEQ